MVYPGKEERGRPRASDSVLAAAGMRVTARYSGAADDLRLADEMLAQARTKQLPSTRTEIGAGGELIDRVKRSDRTWSAQQMARLPTVGQAVVAGDKVTSRTRGRRGSGN